MKLEKQLIGEELIKHLRYDAETGLLWWTVPKQNRDLTRPAGSVNGNGYLNLEFSDETGKRWKFKCHILVWRICKGEWPTLPLDHINRLPTDNHICNLRMVAQQQNTMNRGVAKSNKLGFQNISMKGNSYRVFVRLHGKFITTKAFPTLEQAIQHRDSIRAQYGFQPATDNPTVIAAE